jgi:hypothetical protein
MLKLFLKIVVTGVFFLITACNQYYSDQHIEIKEDGLIYKVGHSAPFTGRVIDTLENKVLEYDVLNGMKHGEFRVSSVEGETSVYGFIKNNLNEGNWKYFYANGQVESTGNFQDDKPHGEWTWFYQNSRIKETGIYIDGKKSGRWFTYDENGIPTKMTCFDSDEVINEINYRFSIHI